MIITFLGTGTSIGVPVIGCKCPTCKSNNPKNTRYRSSIYIEENDYNKNKKLSLLIDTPPEMRLQLLKYKITRVEAVLFTHAHADHLLGFDDIRSLNRVQGKSIPCFGNENTIEDIKRIFNYIFSPLQIGGGVPDVSLHKINSKFSVIGQDIIPLPVKHGQLDILGYRIKNMAYITDCSSIPDTTMEMIQGINTLIIDALRYKPHSTHMNIEQAISVIDELKVERAYLTHLSHEVEHEKVNDELPEYIQLAYDGLKIEV